MFSDTDPLISLEAGGFVWEVIGKWETMGIDIALNHKLTEISFGRKKDFIEYFKTYTKNVAAKMKEQGKGDQINTFNKNIQPYFHELLKSFKDLKFFVGESMDPDAMIVTAIEKEVDVGGEKQERPVMMFFKNGLEEETF